jgi:diaminohydroxyphosphoribosylaminopyrimidine deaminase/5-amino-6-(5-phosphoribosylamino)uracil reductase
MMRCIELAKKGLGTTYPNPLVGCVIVHENEIIGEGWHLKSGQPHAEVNAIESVDNKSLLKNANLYVNLEPCCHYGKTPPCTDLIIENGIKSVIVGSLDPNPNVSGNGIAKLEQSGTKVIQGVLWEVCDRLNKRFFNYHQKKRPYIILKWAQSKDGFIAPDKNTRNGNEPHWISNRHSRQLVHKWRSEEQAIMVGTQTVIDDNPSLSTREWNGSSPIRIVIDRTLRIPKESVIMDGSIKTIVLTEKEKESTELLIYKTIDLGRKSIQYICNTLYDFGIQSVIIEGGVITLQHFIDSTIWDEARVFKSNRYLEDGIKAPVMELKNRIEKNIQSDTLIVYQNE